MDFALTDDQRAIQDAARAFADAELAPHSARWDEEKHFPVDAMKQAAEMGFCGIYTAEEHGGMALGRVEAAVIFEELSRGDVATAAFISGAGTSDLYVVMVRTGGEGAKGISALVVEAGTCGLSFGAQERKMGWNAQPTAIVQFDDCRVPAANLLGEEGAGFRYAMAGLDGGRLNIAACSLGGARLALETAQDYVATRKQFGRPIGEFQALQFRLADMATDLEAARLMVLRGAWAIDTDHPEKTKWCAMAKRLATDACFQIADEALQLHGGYGYLKDYPLERIVRDLRVHRILEGTNEIMRVIIAREMARG